MKPTIFFLLAFLLLHACNNPKPDIGNDNDAADTTDTAMNTDTMVGHHADVDSATMAQAWQNFMTPGPMHKWMAKYDGTWEGEITTWMDPASPMKAPATITQKMDLNGLYQISDYSGTMMGMPFKGHGILAYDNAKKEFISTWVDNMGSGIVILRGTIDTTTQTLNLKGMQTDPVTGKDMPMREEFRFVDDNTQTLAIYGNNMKGQEEKFMEGTFKRK
jgi:hypothetical protein